MASLEELQRQAAELRRRSKQIEDECRQLRRQASECPGSPPATAWVRATTLRVFALAGQDIMTALEYLRWKGRRADEDEVRAWCAGVSASDWQCMLTPKDDNPRCMRQLREARKFLEEKAIVAWVKSRNEAKGIAPTPGAVLDCGAPCGGPSGRRTSRYKWLRRVVSRWGGRKAVFHAGERLPSEVLERKAN